MIKKTVLIAILISLLGCVALAKPQATDDQDKAQIAGPAKHAQRVNQWSNELKAAYEAKDTDKIGELIEQMDNFKARIRKAHAGKRLQDGEKRGKDKQARKAGRFSKDNRSQNKSRMQRPMKQWQSRQTWKKHHKGGQMRSWQGSRHQGRFAGSGQFSNRKFARRGQGMRNQKQQWQGQGGRYQGQGFAEPMMGARQMRQGQMSRQRQGQNQWQGPRKRQGQMSRQRQGQNQWQGPRNMQRQGKFHAQRQMARGFARRQQGQCPMYQGQRGIGRPRYQQKSWGHGQFKGSEFKHQGRGRKRQGVTPPGNEWEW